VASMVTLQKQKDQGRALTPSGRCCRSALGLTASKEMRMKAKTRSKRLAMIPFLVAVVLFAGISGSAIGASVAPVPAVNTTDDVGLKGYDPVAYFTRGEPTPGVDQYTYRWKGVFYRFASAEDLGLFKANPEKYLPQYGGYCAFAISLNRIADIDPSEWTIVDGKLYLNNGLFAQSLWSLNKSGNIASGDRNWPEYPKKPVGQ
jgi:YHS domain-containing protein